MLRLTILLVTVCVGYMSAGKSVVHLEPEKIVEVLPKVMECIAESGVDPEVFDKLRTGAVASLGNEPTIAKFIYCSFLKTGVNKQDGRINTDKLLYYFPSSADKAAITKVIQECDKENKDPVDTTFKFIKCFHEKSPVKVIF